MTNEELTAFKIGLSSIMSIIVGINYKVAFILAILMILDIIIGTLFSMMNGEFVSSEFKKGIVIKILILMLALSLLLFINVLDEVGIEVPFANTFGIMLCFNEMFSILETFSENNVIVPSIVKNWFKERNEELN